MDTENSKTSESNKFIYQFTDKLNLKNPNNKSIGLVHLIIYYAWKNIKSTYNNNKFNISAPTSNDEFDLSDGSYSTSEIQDYFEFIIKKDETLAESPPIQIYPNNKNIGLVNLSIYYTWKDIKPSCSNNKFKISAPTWNDEFDLLEFIIQKHEILAENPPIQIYPNKIKNNCFQSKNRLQTRIVISRNNETIRE